MLALASLTAGGVAAQPGPDAIDALLRPPTAGAPQPPPGTPSPAGLTAPTYVDQTGTAPDGPGSAEAEAYDARLRASALAMRGGYGAMEGGWTLSADGEPLYALQLADRDGYVEGAWRDLRRPGALEASGFIEDAPRSGGEQVLRFANVVVTLRSEGSRWTGRLIEGESTRTVTLVRRGP